MIRTATVLLIASLMPASASQSIDHRLEEKLEHHFEEVDMSALPPVAQRKASAVVQSSASPTDKFFKLHSILSRHDAIVHIDIHGATHLQTADGR